MLSVHFDEKIMVDPCILGPLFSRKPKYIHSRANNHCNYTMQGGSWNKRKGNLFFGPSPHSNTLIEAGAIAVLLRRHKLKPQSSLIDGLSSVFWWYTRITKPSMNIGMIKASNPNSPICLTPPCHPNVQVGEGLRAGREGHPVQDGHGVSWTPKDRPRVLCAWWQCNSYYQ